MANIARSYDDWADTYDSQRNLTRDLDCEVTRTELAEIRCDTILEIGCGTGKNTGFLSSIGERICALDFSRKMLSKARKRPGLGNVTFALADLRNRWPCGEQSADLVVCNLVLEHVDDLQPIFSESCRSLVKGGRLFICELHPIRQHRGARANFQSKEGKREIDAYVHDISDYLDTATERGFELERLGEWRHEEDKGEPPRLVSFLFTAPGRRIMTT
jgi:malonyl-CoA O-methyltransferase